VAEADDTTLVVGLHLKHANPIVQLLGYALILVNGQVVDPYRVRVVRADKGNVAKSSIAEFCMAVACSCPTRKGSAGVGR